MERCVYFVWLYWIVFAYRPNKIPIKIIFYVSPCSIIKWAKIQTKCKCLLKYQKTDIVWNTELLCIQAKACYILLYAIACSVCTHFACNGQRPEKEAQRRQIKWANWTSYVRLSWKTFLMRVMFHDGRLKHSKVKTIASIMSQLCKHCKQIFLDCIYKSGSSSSLQVTIAVNGFGWVANDNDGI